MAVTTLTTELEAVNVILAAIDEAPVSSLALAGLYPLTRAKDALAESSRLVQSYGWEFNTEAGITLALDGSNQLPLPANYLRFDIDRDSAVDAVARGLRLYNRTTRSYTFTAPLKGTAVVLLDWDELPQAARHFITIRAARILQGRSPVSDSTYRYTQEDELSAQAALSESETDVGDFNMLRDSWSVASVLFNHE